jgi:hypothetical protein
MQPRHRLFVTNTRTFDSPLTSSGNVGCSRHFLKLSCHAYSPRLTVCKKTGSSRLIFSGNYETPLTAPLSPTQPRPTISRPRMWMKQAQASQQSAFIDINYPAKAEETAPFNRVAAAMAFKNSPAPSSSPTACSHLHLQRRPPRNKAGRSWFSAFCLPWFSIPERRAYVFQFVRLHFGPKVIDVLP